MADERAAPVSASPQALPGELADHLARWVGEGIITEDQAAAIGRSEQRQQEYPHGPPAEASAAPSPVGWVVMGYLGAALALIAGLFLVVSYGQDLASWTGVTVLAVLATLLAAAGAWLVRQPEGAVAGLGDFAWLLATGATAGAIGVLTAAVLEWQGEHAALAVSIGVLLVAIGFWRRRRHVLEHIALYGGVLATVMSGLAVIIDAGGLIAGSLAYGLTIWGVGAIWTILGWAEFFPPRWGAFVLGVGTMYIGGMTAAVSNDWWLVLGSATVLLLLVAAARLDDKVLLGLGLFGLFVFVPRVLVAILGEEAGPLIPLVVLLLGLLLLGLAIRRSRHRSVVAP